MGVVIPQIITEDRASVAQFIDGSLKFDDTKGTNLTRTFSASNRRTWTWSGWVRRNGTGGTGDVLFSGYNGTANQDTYITFVNSSTSSGTTDAIALFSPPAGNNVAVVSTGVFRDHSSWYHIVVSCDTTQSTAADRSKIYINGEEVTYSTTTYPSEDEELAINKNSDHSIGDRPPGNSALFDGAMSQVYFIDGLAIGPEYFGFTDPLTNTWRPKKFKAEGTTYNDGTVWSSGSTVTGGSISNAADGFDGDLSSSGAHCTLTATDSNTTANVTFAVNFKNVTKVEVFVHSASSSGDTRGTCETPNGVTFTSSTLTSASQSFHTIYEGEPIRLKNIGWGINQNGQTGTSSDAFRAFRINGEILIDSTTRNLAFGTNGFYLPMDGNSPIGEDRSGKGNDFTPTNFGGSVALDNSQVSGARPILNTTPGGTQAVVGVFGSKENATYTATGSSGSGSGYAFDGVSGNNPSFSFIRGATYTFDYSAASGHPIRFSSTDPDSSTTAYTTGTNTATSNVIKFTVPHDAPDNLWYYCTNHSNMNGAITVTTDNTKADQYASNCTLALPLVGNDDDVCASIACTANNKTPTNSSVVAATTQSNFYSGSHYWSANSDTLQYAQQGNELVFGTGDFTIECWVYDDNGHDGTSNRCYIFDNRIGGSVTGDPPTMVAFVDTHSEWNLYIVTPDASIAVEVGTAAIIDRWNHFAVTREGSTVRMFVNGIQLGSSTSSINFTNNGIGVGRATDASYGWAGYIQDFRVYTGVAKYTSNFVPAATSPDFLPDTPSGVSGGSKLTKITDGAVAFDGSGDYLSLASSSDFTFGETGDFTIEFYLYLNDTTDCGLISNMTDWNTSSGYNNLFAVAVQSNVVRWFNSAGTVTIADSGTSTNRWCHYAFCREGSTITMYKDGISVGTQSGGSQTYSGQEILKIGSITNLGDLNGFISNTRIIKGTALYTSNFTPPSAPLTSVTNTKLLCCQSNTLAGSATVAPTISGLNDGRVWSSGSTTGTVYASDNDWNNVFNGVAGNDKAIAADDATYEITLPGGGISGVTKVEIYGQQQSGAANATITLSSAGEQSVAQGTSLGYTTFYTGSSDTLTKLKVASTSSNRSSINAVRINDTTILTDPLANSVGASPDAAATTFNPFNTDINTVRGQETGYATMNPIGKTKTAYFVQDGNLTCGNSSAPSGSSGARGFVPSTIGFKTGKWYAECETFRASDGDVDFAIGIFAEDSPGYYTNDGKTYSCRPDAKLFSPGGANQSYGVAWADGDCIGIKVDMDSATKTIQWLKNGIATGDPVTISTDHKFFFGYGSDGGGSGRTYTAKWNFGQKPFKFPPPDGFQPLNNANTRPVKVFARPDQFFKPLLYNGNGGTAQSVTGLDFKPDFVWYKHRSAGSSHGWFDVVRGTGRYINSNGTGADQAVSGVTSFDPNGFSLGTDTGGNGSGTWVAWCWKAGGNSNTFNVDDVGYASASAAGLTAGDTTVTGASVGTKQGFSIIKYTGPNDTSNHEVPHGLSQAPDFIITKNLDDTYNWDIYHSSLADDAYLIFTNAATRAQGFNGRPTSTVFKTEHDYSTDENDDYIAYCWHDVPGLQKFGKYEGNENADGTYVELGFRPALIFVKNIDTSSTHWVIVDKERDTTNPLGTKLAANLSNGDFLGGSFRAECDFLSNGFKMRGDSTDSSGMNKSDTYIYCAWAEAPTVNLYGGGANAR